MARQDRARMKGIAEIGAFRHKITIQQATETQGDDGAVVQAWATFATPYAEIVPLSGSENYVAQGITASVAYRITCRYVSGVIPKMRILWGSRDFLIYAVRNLDEQNRFLVMTCEELDV